MCLLAGAIGSGSTSPDVENGTLNTRDSEHAECDDFGPYRILRVLGEGGMGTVYLVEQNEPIRRRVALKVVKLGMDTSQILARFNHERQSLARMEHSNIARILDAGATPRGRPFFVMDYIEGASITSYCEANRLTMKQRVELFIPICRAVQHAHNKGIIHRDIKPSNVLVTIEDGDPIPKVIDFGIARAIDTGDAVNTLCTQFGQMVGTPEYASPEQADMVAGEISSATDVYSLGVLLYELLVGVVPFDGALLRKVGFAEMIRIIREEQPPSLVEALRSQGPDATDIATRRGTDTATLQKLLDGDLNWIVKKALEKSPLERYASPADLSADIERYLEGEPVLANPPRRWRKFRTPLIAIAAGAVVVLAASRIERTFDLKPSAKITSTVVLADLANDTSDHSFDNAFRQSITFELQRTTGVNLLTETRIREVLSQMRRPAGTSVTPEIAREICVRTGSAALIETSLSGEGSGYLLGIRARNCTNSGLVDGELSQVVSRNDVLKELQRLTTSLMAKSATTLASLQKNSTPLEEATTSSLEALRAFTTARQQLYGISADGTILFKRATELDPEFALAYAYLGRAQADFGEQRLAMESASRAYRLRGNASDKENFFITYNYDREVLRNFELCRQVCESWSGRYPQDMMPHGLLSGLISKGTAQYEKSIAEGEKAIAISPDFTIGYQNVAESYLFLNRPKEATAVFQRAVQRNLPSKDSFAVVFFSAFLEGDRATMDKVSAQIAASIPNGVSEHYASLVSAYEGRLRQSRHASNQAVNLAAQGHFSQRASLFEGAAALREALYGNNEESLRHVSAARQLATGRDADFPPAFASALCRHPATAMDIARRMEKEYSEDTCVRFTYAPALRALLAINQGRPATAIEILDRSKPYELAQNGISLYFLYGALYPTYVRGLAYRQLQKHREAAAEFQRMLDHPGLLLADPVGPVARLQLARSLRDAGDTVKAKNVYRDLLALWKDADTDIPLLQQAKAEAALL